MSQYGQDPQHSAVNICTNMCLAGVMLYYFCQYGWNNPDFKPANYPADTYACWASSNVQLSPKNFEIVKTPTGSTV